MEKIETISVITVTYNNKDELLRTLNNVLNQTYNSVEVIVVDGNSNDGTKDVIKQFGNKIIAISEPDDGIYDAMNKGLDYATGEWVIFMNAGDIFANDTVLSSIFSKPIPLDKDVIYSDYQMRDAEGKLSEWHTDRLKGIVHHQSTIYRKSLHSKHGKYVITHPYIISDLIFFLSISEKSYLKTPINISIIDGTGVSSATWSREQAWGLRIAYGIETLPSVFRQFFKMKIGQILHKILCPKLFNVIKNITR